MCQLKNGCPGEFGLCIAYTLPYINFLILEFLGHTNAIKYIILEIISWKQYVSGIFFEFARYGHTLTSVSSEHAQIVKIVLAINGCTTFIFTIYKKC